MLQKNTVYTCTDKDNDSIVLSVRDGLYLRVKIPGNDRFHGDILPSLIEALTEIQQHIEQEAQKP